MAWRSISVRARTTCFKVLLVVVGLLQGLAMVEGALHGVEQVLALEGLEQVVISAAAHGVDGHADVMNGGDHNDGELRLLAVNALQQRDAVAVLHHDVGEDQVKGVALQDVEAFASAGGELHIVALALQTPEGSRFFVSTRLNAKG
jgi:hypothetical protein